MQPPMPPPGSGRFPVQTIMPVNAPMPTVTGEYPYGGMPMMGGAPGWGFPSRGPMYGSMPQYPMAQFEMEPEFLERVVEYPKVNVEHLERLVEVPQPQVVDRLVEVPQVTEIIKEYPGKVYKEIVAREAPVVDFQQQELVSEISQIEYKDRYVEVPEIHEVVRVIPRIEVREIPIERIIQVPKKIIQEIEQPIYHPVPRLVKQPVTRQIPVPRTQVQTMEVVKQSPNGAWWDGSAGANFNLTTTVVDRPVPVPVPVPVGVFYDEEFFEPTLGERMFGSGYADYGEVFVDRPVPVPVQGPPQVIEKHIIQPQQTIVEKHIHHQQQQVVAAPPAPATQYAAPAATAVQYAAPPPTVAVQETMAPVQAPIVTSFTPPVATPPKASYVTPPVAVSQPVASAPMTGAYGMMGVATAPATQPQVAGYEQVVEMVPASGVQPVTTVGAPLQSIPMGGTAVGTTVMTPPTPPSGTMRPTAVEQVPAAYSMQSNVAVQPVAYPTQSNVAMTGPAAVQMPVPYSTQSNVAMTSPAAIEQVPSSYPMSTYGGMSLAGSTVGPEAFQSAVMAGGTAPAGAMGSVRPMTGPTTSFGGMPTPPMPGMPSRM